jgi:hypothetical protein
LLVEPLEDRSLLSGGTSYQVLATLGDPVALPTGPAFRINDFEPNGLNNKGDFLFGNDLGTANDPATYIGEGIFLRSHGQETVLASGGASAPGGGTYDSALFFGPASLNASGDAGFTFQLSPFMLPYGVNGGTFRYSHNTNTVTPVVLPFVTPAPTGGVFQGTSFYPSLNDRGNLAFVGIVQTDQGIHIPGEDYIGLAEGVFKADQGGQISTVVAPGDAAPGGGTFDFAGHPWINNRGDVVFEGHLAGRPAQIPGFPPQSVLIAALSDIYLKDGVTGAITPVGHVGDAAPGGGTIYWAFGPQINDGGDVIFEGMLSPAFDRAGLFHYSDGVVTSIAHPGDAMPGGGHLVTISLAFGNQEHINRRGDVVFNATLDTDADGDGLPDQGIYQWSNGQVSLLARSGTVLPGIGTIETLVPPSIITIPPPVTFVPTGGAVNNDRGQLLFSALLTDGRFVMLLASPTGGGANTAAASAGAEKFSIPAGFSNLASATVTNLIKKTTDKASPISELGGSGSAVGRPDVRLSTQAASPVGGSALLKMSGAAPLPVAAIDALFAGVDADLWRGPLG